jgi:PAS domain S-box-containing protein
VDEEYAMTKDRLLASANVEILHEAVEAFRKREIGYRDILEDLPAAIYTTDCDGRITYFNRACVDLAGRTPVLGDDQWCVTWKLFAADGTELANSEAPMAVALRERRALRGEENIAERPDGSRITILSYPTPIFDAAGECIGAVDMLVDTTEQSEARDRLALLAREVDHRSNNLLAVIQSFIRLTQATSVDEYKQVLEGRLTALAQTNRLIGEARWQNVNLKSLLEEELEAASNGKVSIRGETLAIRPGAAQSLAMIVHELWTNAVKHGGLSSPAGTIAVHWAVDADRELMLTWEENGGPPVEEPSRSNTGNRVIDAAVRQLGARLFREWRPKGLRCTLLCGTAKL